MSFCLDIEIGASHGTNFVSQYLKFDMALEILPMLKYFYGCLQY